MIKRSVMKDALTLLLISIFITGTATSQTAVRNVNELDVENQKILPRYDVLAMNGRITYLGKKSKLRLPDNVKVIDGSGKYLVPGFANAHVHSFKQVAYTQNQYRYLNFFLSSANLL